MESGHEVGILLDIFSAKITTYLVLVTWRRCTKELPGRICKKGPASEQEGCSESEKTIPCVRTFMGLST